MASASAFSGQLIAAAGLFLGCLQGQSPGAVSVTVYGPLLEPVPNAEVSIHRPDWSLVKEGKSDGSGQFFYSGREGEWVYCRATAPGMHVGWEFTPPLTAKNSPVYVEVKLFAAAAVRGSVRDENGKTIPGAEVIAVMENAPLMLFKGVPEVATTDANGDFLLPRTPLGEIFVRASAEGHELGEASVYLRQNSTVDVVLKQGRGRQLEVTVEGVPPERLPDIVCKFFASRPFPRPSMALPPRLRGTFDATGKCLVVGLPRDVELSMIRLEAGGMKFHPQWQEVAAGKDGRVTFKMEAITGPRPVPVRVTTRTPAVAAEPSPAPKVVANPTLRGVLRDEDAKPRGLTRVRMYSDSTGWHEAVTAEDGTFAVDAQYARGEKIAFELRNPDWVLAEDEKPVAHSFGASTWREYAKGVVQELVVVEAAKFRGKVIAPRGHSAAGLRVLLETLAPGGSLPRMLTSAGTTDATGAFVIDGVRPPKGNVWLVVRGLRGTAEAGPLKYEGREMIGIELKIDPPLEVTGAVVGKSGKPLPGARVALSASTGRSGPSLPGGEVTVADAQGRFAFRGMKPGDYSLEVTVRGQEVAARTASFEVGDKKRSSDHKITVPSD